MTEPVLLSLSSAPLFGLPLADLWFWFVFFLLGMFLFLDGFDFGIGALFALVTDHEEREQLLAAVGPFWDGNEVWLVVFGGALFAAFPPVYANLFSRHYLLMFAILFALALRGLAPEFYEQRENADWRRAWGAAFVVGSVGAPFALGMFAANWLLGATTIVTIPGVVVGLVVVALTVVQGAAFLGLKTRGEIRERMGSYGVYATVAYLVLVVLTLAYLYLFFPGLHGKLLSVVVLGLVVLSVVFAGVFVYATRADRYYSAVVGAGGLVFALMGVVGTLMFPNIDPAANLTVGTAVVPPLSLNLMTIMAAIFLPIVLVYFAVLYNAFSGPIEAGEAY